MTSPRRLRMRVAALAAAGAAGWLAACYQYGVRPDMPLPQADAAPAVAAPAQPAAGYRNAVARAAPSVVSVYGAGELSQGGIAAAVQTLSIASGVIVDRSGLVVTNGRLLEGARQLMVALGDGTPCAATLVGFDSASGIALLKIEAAGLEPIEMGDMASLAVGDIVLAIGNPPGVGQTVSQGIVGAIGRKGRGLEGYIETDAAIAPGGYGGALVDTAGRLVGLTFLSVAVGDETPTIRFAIPVDRMQEVVNRLKKTGRDA